MSARVGVPAPVGDDGNLLHALVARARETPVAGLAACAVDGALALAGALVWGQSTWFVTLPLVALGAFGLWGLCDRAERRRAADRPADAPPALPELALAAVRVASGAAGVATGLLAMLILLGGLLGKIIS